MAKHHKKHHEEGEGGEAWLLPYSDLMTLLLAVFIVLFAVSKVDVEKAKAISDAFRGIISSTGGSTVMDGGEGILDSETAITLPIATEASQATPTPTESSDSLSELFSQSDLQGLETLQKELQEYFKDSDLLDGVSTVIDERGLVISLTNSILFDSGSANIKNETMNILVDIGKGISPLDNYIRVEGHTDNVPIGANSLYPTNWELSGARAASVARLFIERSGISPDRLATVGYAEFRPVADNSTAEGRAQNRRVDIIVLNMKYDSLEKPGTN